MSVLKPAAFIVAPFVGTIPGYYVTRKNIEGWYKNVRHAPWHPPRWIIAPTWTVMYSCIGYASWLVYRDGGGFGGPARGALMWYGAQLALNWAYPHILMTARSFDLAYAEILTLIGVICGTTYKFRVVNRTAGSLMVPYLVWICYASTLNLWSCVHNRGLQGHGRKQGAQSGSQESEAQSEDSKKEL